MASYVVTGSSKGLGFAFLEFLSKNPENTVIGLARNKAPLEEKLKSAGLAKVVVLEADVGDLESLKAAAKATVKITGGDLDVLINNAALVSAVSEFKSFSDFATDPTTLENDMLSSFKVNTLGLLNTIQAFLPLIRAGSLKKFVNISTGVADLDLINEAGVEVAGPYAVSKAAANVVMAKYSAAHQKEGILFLSVSPGYVDTERNAEAGSNDAAAAQDLGRKFAVYAPHFTRMLTTEESVGAVMDVVEKKSVKAGDGGKFVSHKGNQEWL